MYELSRNIGLFRIRALSTHDLLLKHHYDEDPNLHLSLDFLRGTLTFFHDDER